MVRLGNGGHLSKLDIIRHIFKSYGLHVHKDYSIEWIWPYNKDTDTEMLPYYEICGLSKEHELLLSLIYSEYRI